LLVASCWMQGAGSLLTWCACLRHTRAVATFEWSSIQQLVSSIKSMDF